MSIKTYLHQLKPAYDIPWDRRGRFFDRQLERCPYCSSKNMIKRGHRRTKHETVQLYQCKDCQKTFTPKILKSKQYPLKVIFDSLSYYNLGHTKADACRIIKEKYGLKVTSDTLTNWINELLPQCRYDRLRKIIHQHYRSHEIIQSAVLNHKQTYHYRYHHGKLNYSLAQTPFSQPRFQGIKDYLQAIQTDYPHHYFKTDNRSSQIKASIDFNQARITKRENYATRLARLLLQAVRDNKLRHDALQQFMLVNDSVTVAMEVPVFLHPDDLDYYTRRLKFKIPFQLDQIMTGHIDLLQLRYRYVYILDYKPRAKRQKPFAQLLSYALALSRLTGLKLMDFKCAWFDENDYFEFFPLQLVHKLPPKYQKPPR